MKPIFNIRPVDPQPKKEVEYRIYQHLHHNPTPGLLHHWALRWGLIHHPNIPISIIPSQLVFASDYGLYYELPSPEESLDTPRHFLDFLNGHTAYARLLASQGVLTCLVDAGLNHNFEREVDFWLHRNHAFFDRKMGYGCNSPVLKPTMTTYQLSDCLDYGAELVNRLYGSGTNALILSSLGDGGYLGSALIYGGLQNNGEEVFQKLSEDGQKLLARVRNKHPKTHDPLMLLNLFGGFDLAMLTGAVLQAADLKMAIFPSDGQSLMAVHLAAKWYPQIADYVFLKSPLTGCIAGAISPEFTAQAHPEEEPLLFGISALNGLNSLRLAAGVLG